MIFFLVFKNHFFLGAICHSFFFKHSFIININIINIFYKLFNVFQLIFFN